MSIGPGPDAEGWLGHLPVGWSVRRLGALGELVKGRGGSKQDNRDNGVAVVRYGDLYTKFDTVITWAPAFIDAENTANYSPLPNGSLLFAASGESAEEIGKSALVLLDEPAVTGGDTVVFHPGGQVDPLYLAYALESAPLRASKALRGTGFTVVHISAGKLKTLPIPLPPLDEQRAIADHLDRETARIDTLIEEQQRLIEMLRERRASVISSALTPSATWERRRIKHLGDASLGKMLDAGRAARAGDELKPYVRAADVRSDGSVNLSDLNEMPFSSAEMESFALRAGDVLLIEGGATVGRPGFMWESAPGIAFQKTVNRLRVDRQTDPRFVYWSMLRLYESSYYPNHYGAVSFVHLTGEKLREIELDLPSLSEQRDIAVQLDEQTAKIDELTAETERFIDLSWERRSALITAAVTGKIDTQHEVG